MQRKGGGWLISIEGTWECIQECILQFCFGNTNVPDIDVEIVWMRPCDAARCLQRMVSRAIPG